MHQADCIFCKIIKGEIPTQTKIYEDKNTFVFLSNGPLNFGHALVIPYHHYESVLELPDEVFCQMAPILKKTALAVKAATEADGFNITINNGKASGQAIFHAHFHVIPRYHNDGYKSWENDKKYKAGEDKAMAEKIKSFWD